jgi:hypothetical protein
LLTFNDATIASLPEEKLANLARSGALALGYAQFFSQGRFADLQARAKA